MVRLIALSAVLILAVSSSLATAQVSGTAGTAGTAGTTGPAGTPTPTGTTGTAGPARPTGTTGNVSTTAPSVSQPQPVAPTFGTVQPNQPTQPVQPAQPWQPSQPGTAGAGPMMNQLPAGSIAVDSGSMYIINNNQLMRVDKSTGQVQASTVLPSIQSQPAAPGAGPGLTTTQPGTLQPGMQGQQPGVSGQQPGVSGQQPATGAAAGAGPQIIRQQTPSVAVDENSVYIFQGDQVLKYRKADFQYLGCTLLPSCGTTSRPAAVGAGPYYTGANCPPAGSITNVGACPPVLVYTQSGPGCVSPCPPVAVGAGPITVCPPSTICVTPTNAYKAELDQLGGLCACDLELSYLRSIARLNAGPIVWSQLAQMKATQPQLQSFAAGVVASACAENQQIGRWTGEWYSTQAPAVMTPEDAQIYNKLQCLSGSDFDVAYMQAMIVHANQVRWLSSTVEERVCHAQVGRAIGSARSAADRQASQLATWLRDWYNVTTQACPACP